VLKCERGNPTLLSVELPLNILTGLYLVANMLIVLMRSFSNTSAARRKALLLLCFLFQTR